MTALQIPDGAEWATSPLLNPANVGRYIVTGSGSGESGRMRDLSSTELLEALGGRITYRQLHRWVQLGRVHLDSPGSGSGTRHRFSPAEARAIADFVDMRDRVASGAYYTERLRHHLGIDDTAGVPPRVGSQS